MSENEVGTIILEAAIEVHKNLGPGLLESVYESAMAFELAARGLTVERQVPIVVKYKGIQLDEGFRADLVVNKLVIIELKSIEAISNVHKKQIQTYLRLTGMKLGYLLNFGGELMKDGIVRAVNGLANEPLRASAPLREMHLSSAEQTGGTI